MCERMCLAFKLLLFEILIRDIVCIFLSFPISFRLLVIYFSPKLTHDPIRLLFATIIASRVLCRMHLREFLTRLSNVFDIVIIASQPNTYRERMC